MSFLTENNMSITPDTYIPSIDNSGNYVDKIPRIYNGIYCQCGSRKNHAYNASTFAAHIKTYTHQRWLNEINNNKTNYLSETMELRETVKNQKQIIGSLENQMKTKSLTIDYLTEELSKYKNIQSTENIDLLDM
jgi:DNA-binding transcriptional regulator GbsR (MarR family)